MFAFPPPVAQQQGVHPGVAQQLLQGVQPAVALIPQQGVLQQQAQVLQAQGVQAEGVQPIQVPIPILIDPLEPNARPKPYIPIALKNKLLHQTQYTNLRLFLQTQPQCQTPDWSHGWGFGSDIRVPFWPSWEICVQFLENIATRQLFTLLWSRLIYISPKWKDIVPKKVRELEDENDVKANPKKEIKGLAPTPLWHNWKKWILPQIRHTPMEREVMFVSRVFADYILCNNDADQNSFVFYFFRVMIHLQQHHKVPIFALCVDSSKERTKSLPLLKKIASKTLWNASSDVTLRLDRDYSQITKLEDPPYYLIPLDHHSSKIEAHKTKFRLAFKIYGFLKHRAKLSARLSPLQPLDLLYPLARQQSSVPKKRAHELQGFSLSTLWKNPMEGYKALQDVPNQHYKVQLLWMDSIVHHWYRQEFLLALETPNAQSLGKDLLQLVWYNLSPFPLHLSALS